MTETSTMEKAFEVLRLIFHDMPELLKIVTAADIMSQHVADEMRTNENLFSSCVTSAVAGRTNVGKSTFNNTLYKASVLPDAGTINCTDFIGLIYLTPTNRVIDTPGAGSNERFENIARVGFGLPQLEDNRICEIEVRDYTGAKHPDDFKNTKYKLDEWEAGIALDYEPDIVLFIVAPHMGLLRDDEKYFASLVRKYDKRVLVVINEHLSKTNGTRLATDANVLDVYNYLTKRYQTTMKTEETPQFVEVNALTGAGMDQLILKMAAILPDEKLGQVGTVLADELQAVAEQELNRMFTQKLNQIAARISCYKVDESVSGDDLVGIAALGVAGYAAKVTGGTDSALANLDALQWYAAKQVDAIKEQRKEDIVTKEARTETRRDTIRKQKYKEVIEERDVMFQTGGYVPIEKKRNLFGQVLTGKSTYTDYEYQNNITRRGKVKVPRQVEDGFTEETGRSYEVFLGYINHVVDTRALRGGLSVIELVLSVGYGVKAFVMAQAKPEALTSTIEEHKQRLHLQLAPHTAAIDRAVEEGNEVQVLNILSKHVSAS